VHVALDVLVGSAHDAMQGQITPDDTICFGSAGNQTCWPKVLFFVAVGGTALAFERCPAPLLRHNSRTPARYCPLLFRFCGLRCSRLLACPMGRSQCIILIVWCVRYCNRQRTIKRQQRNNVVLLEERSFRQKEQTQGVC
jgi:hypothetical protein